MYPNAVGEFVFDQSSAHGAFAKDALNAKEMNVSPGGKQHIMHDTFILLNNPHHHLQGQPQSMVFPLDLPPTHPYYEYRGKPKGMWVVLEERGLLKILTDINSGKLLGECKFCKSSREVQEKLIREAQAASAGEEEPGEMTEDVLQASTSTKCCMRKALQSQADFRAEKPLLQTVIEEAGHKCYFLPKFHCELNLIEMYWGWCKSVSFSILCDILPVEPSPGFRAVSDSSFSKAKELVPDILDSCPTGTIWAFFRKTWRYMDAYHR